MSLKIFLSHAWSDKNLAAFKAIEARLRGAGHEVWVDKRGIEFGEEITPKLDAAIADSDLVLVLWSENAHRSKAVCHEIDTTVRLGKRLVPCKITAYDPGAYEALRDRKYLRFDVQMDFGLLHLSQLAARLESARNPALRDHAELQSQIVALNEALTEVEDSIVRREQGVSGNTASGTYIHAMLEAGKKLIATSQSMSSDEKARVAHFMSLVQEIALEFPDPKDDPVKEEKMVAAISEADPEAQSQMLQTFKVALAQSVQTRRGHAATPPQSSPPEPSSPANFATPPPLSMVSPLHAHITAVRQIPNADGLLRQRLQELLPGAGATQIPAYEQALNQAIDAVPQLLGALEQAAQQAGIAHLMAPLLQQAQGYFFAADDLIPDHHGTLGLLDDAYLVHAFLFQVNYVYQSQTGRPLIAYDPTQTIQVLRGVLGPAIAQQLDQAVVSAVNQVVQQSYYQQMAQQGVSMNPGGGLTGGPGSWGGSWEDEMARMGAEIGISFN